MYSQKQLLRLKSVAQEGYERTRESMRPGRMDHVIFGEIECQAEMLLTMNWSAIEMLGSMGHPGAMAFKDEMYTGLHRSLSRLRGVDPDAWIYIQEEVLGNNV